MSQSQAMGLFPLSGKPTGKGLSGEWRGWLGKCPVLREARPSSERAVIPSLPGSRLELGLGGVLKASALVLHLHLAIIRLAQRIPVKRARLLGWIKVKGRLAERTPVPRPHSEGPTWLPIPLGMSKRHFKDMASPLSSHMCPFSPCGRPYVQVSWGSIEL